ncbi:MAG TPA: YbaK/EbsC family protein [Dehalococcoidia bacterium]|nr:YbaK/EbsC family protein [Dehalococcoidia bacterium]
MVQPASVQRVIDAARDLGLEIEVHKFPEGTRTAEDAARAIGVSLGQIVKSLVFMADGRAVICFVSGTNRLDTDRLAAATGTTEVRRANADEVREATGFAVGGVPPFGHATAVTVFCDPDLLQYDAVWAAGGTPMTVFPIAPQALVKACNATVTDLKEAQ